MQIARRIRLGKVWPLFEMFRDKTTEGNRIVKDFLHPIVQKAIEDKVRMADSREGHTADEISPTFLSHLASSTNSKWSAGMEAAH